MKTEFLYEKIYETLLSEEEEDCVPDGVSISHPVVGLWKGKVVDCVLLYPASMDGEEYGMPVARVLVDPEKEQVVSFTEFPIEEHGERKRFLDDDSDWTIEQLEEAEKEYQTSYIGVRRIAFRQNLPVGGRELLVRYIKAFKAVERTQLQSYLIDLSSDFFRWAVQAIKFLPGS